MNRHTQIGPLPPSNLARDIGWSGLAQAWNLSLTIASALIVARLLSPGDYAVMAVVLPVITIAQVIQAMGMSSAIVQAREVHPHQLDALFWLIFAVALALMGLIALMAAPLAALVENPRVGPALVVANLSILFAALSVLPNALQARALQFRAIALREIAAATMGTGTLIVLAALTRSHWALLVGTILIPLTNLILSATAMNWRPGSPVWPSRAGPLLGFGFNIWGANLFQTAARNADNLIVGRFSSQQMLGIYDRSYRVLFNPLNQAVVPFGKVLMPSLARAQEDPSRYREIYWHAVAILLLACHPGLALALTYPKTVIGLLLGPSWLEGAPLFQWFALGGLFQIFLGTTGWLFISQGRGGEFLRLNIATAGVALASFVIGIRWGVEGVAMVFVLGQVGVALPLSLWLAGRSGPVSWRDFAEGLLPHVIATSAVAGLVFAERIVFGLPLWPQLIATALAAYLVYAAVLLVMPASRGTMLAMGRWVRARMPGSWAS